MSYNADDYPVQLTLNAFEVDYLCDSLNRSIRKLNKLIEEYPFISEYFIEEKKFIVDLLFKINQKDD